MLGPQDDEGVAASFGLVGVDHAVESGRLHDVAETLLVEIAVGTHLTVERIAQNAGRMKRQQYVLRRPGVAVRKPQGPMDVQVADENARALQDILVAPEKNLLQALVCAVARAEVKANVVGELEAFEVVGNRAVVGQDGWGMRRAGSARSVLLQLRGRRAAVLVEPVAQAAGGHHSAA